MSLGEARGKTSPANAVGRTDKDITMAAIKDNTALGAIEISGWFVRLKTENQYNKALHSPLRYIDGVLLGCGSTANKTGPIPIA